MSTAGCYMKTAGLLVALLLPVVIVDRCLTGGDPVYYLAPGYCLAAIAPGHPLTLVYTPRADDPDGWKARFQIHDVQDFRMSDRVFVGQCCGGYSLSLNEEHPAANHGQFFLVDRQSNGVGRFGSAAERDDGLRKRYGIRASDLREMPWYAGLRASPLFPFNWLYYMGTTIGGVVGAILMARRKRRVTANHSVERPSGD